MLIKFLKGGVCCFSVNNIGKATKFMYLLIYNIKIIELANEKFLMFVSCDKATDEFILSAELIKKSVLTAYQFNRTYFLTKNTIEEIIAHIIDTYNIAIVTNEMESLVLDQLDLNFFFYKVFKERRSLKKFIANKSNKFVVNINNKNNNNSSLELKVKSRLLEIINDTKEYEINFITIPGSQSNLNKRFSFNIKNIYNLLNPADISNDKNYVINTKNGYFKCFKDNIPFFVNDFLLATKFNNLNEFKRTILRLKICNIDVTKIEKR